MLVYFVTDGEFLKIGYTSRNIHKRIKELSTGNSKSIYLCGYISNGSMDLEQQLHKKFEYVKKNREWYYASPFLLDYINEHTDMMAEIENVVGQIYVYKKKKIV